jgi:hypothetical protein
MSARFSQSHGIVPVVVPLALNYNTGFTGDSINMGKYNHVTLIILGSADVAGTGVLKIKAATTLAGTTADVTFTYRYISVDAAAATLADVLSTPATSAALTFVEATLVSGMYIIEWDAEDMNVSGVQYTYATPVIDAAGTAGMVSIAAILSEPRYETGVMPTAIV